MPAYAEASAWQPSLPLRGAKAGGPDRDQTDDLVVANDALYQLSYRPDRKGRYWEIGARK
jgi:hypothetical protein